MVTVRFANSEADVSAVDAIFSEQKKFLGYVMRVALMESMQKGKLLVAVDDETGDIIGAVNFNVSRKNGYITIYEIATSSAAQGKGAGRVLVDELKKYRQDIKLKVTEDNEGAQAFYKKLGFEHVATEKGKKRRLFVMYMKNSPQKNLF